MRRFRERDLVAVGVVSVAVTVALIFAALNFSSLPLISTKSDYSADLADASNLTTGDFVTVYGAKVGQIQSMTLMENKVRVRFSVNDGLHLGSATSAAVKILSPIGTEVLALTPNGSGRLSGAIPLSRTATATNLVAELDDLGQNLGQFDTATLEQALAATSQDLDSTSAAETASAFTGLARTSEVLTRQRDQIAEVIDQGAALATVLSQRSGQLIDLISQSSVVLQVLQQRQAVIKQLLSATNSLSQQISQIISVNRQQLGSFLSSLQVISSTLASESRNVSQAIPLLAAFSKYTANTTGSGPFADVAVPTLLLPDNLLAACSQPGAFPSSNPNVGCRK